MEPKLSLNSTGNAGVDRALQGLVGIFEAVFSGRIRGYYLEGTYADQTALTTSDIDIVILFKDSFVDKVEYEKAEQLAADYNAASPLEIDVRCLDEKQIAEGVPPSLKLGSTVLFGEAIPDKFPLVSVVEWGRERMHAAYWLMTKVFGRPNVVTYPRDYPQPEAEFYGYTERKIHLADGREVPSTRDLIRVLGWAGTALVALLGNQIVARKKECHVLYRKHINDEWTSLFESLYKKCREEWQYRIPEEPGERDKLRLICQRALEFENHFLSLYKQFLLSELRGADVPAKSQALWIQEKIPYIDPEISGLIQELADSGNKALNQQATQARQAIDSYLKAG